ncbi:hypothetical protein IMSAG049_01487 [Clostridiales bacterium]|nr:hypothetical protein IMSAG049_01487 [Clostridiales bacterium]
MELIKKALIAYVSFAFIFVVLGICFLAWPQTSILTICYILGAVTLAWGMIKISVFVKGKSKSFLSQFNLILGIFLAVTGALLIVFPKFIIPAIPIVIGIMITFDGFHKIKVGFEAKSMGHESWWLIEIVSLITIVFGVCLILNPFDATNAMVRLLGFALLVDGLQNIIVIINTFRLMSQIILQENLADAEFKEEDIPTSQEDVKTEEIKPEDMIIEDKK